MIAPKSAIVLAAITSCPSVEPLSPASLSTGISTPSEVAESAIATSSGASTRPASLRPPAATSAIANDTAKLTPASFRTRPRKRAKSISRPARKSRNASPSVATTAIVSSTCTHPSTLGPTTIPATISNTTAGARTRGKSPRRNGAPKATAETIRSPLNEGMDGGHMSTADVTRGCNVGARSGTGATWTIACSAAPASSAW